MTADASPISTASDPRRRVGARGERLAAAHLARSGYEVLERNFRTRHGELDLVAAGRGCLVFCEVRSRVAAPAGARHASADPLESIGPRKRRRLRRMAREWLMERGGRPDTAATTAARRAGALRFDAIGVLLTADGRPLALEHVEDAF